LFAAPSRNPCLDITGRAGDYSPRLFFDFGFARRAETKIETWSGSDGYNAVQRAVATWSSVHTLGAQEFFSGRGGPSSYRSLYCVVVTPQTYVLLHGNLQLTQKPIKPRVVSYRIPDGGISVKHGNRICFHTAP